jgi:hypothetical protein
MNKNNKLHLSIALIVLSLAVGAQDSSSILSGQITGPFDGLVANAPIQVTRIDSGERWRSRSDADGRYQFEELPAGDYRIQINIGCCEYKSYRQEPVEVVQSSPRVFDIQLEQGFQLNTIGDDFAIAAAQILEELDLPDLPMPRMADGKPHLSGMWLYGSDPFPIGPKLNEKSAKLVAERNANNYIESPRIRCLPTSLPIPGHTPPTFGKFVHEPGLIVILYEGVLGFRQIFTDGREHPEDPNPSWLGHSVGHWEGDTLVVDTVGFNDRGWTGLSHPRSENFHVVERYTRTSYGEMELELTIEDPEVYLEPWVQEIPVYFTPGEELLEFVCENDKWVQPE